jgi:hypothetical protein
MSPGAEDGCWAVATDTTRVRKANEMLRSIMGIRLWFSQCPSDAWAIKEPSNRQTGDGGNLRVRLLDAGEPLNTAHPLIGVGNQYRVWAKEIHGTRATPNDCKLSDSGPGMGAARREANARDVPGLHGGQPSRQARGPEPAEGHSP